MSRQIEIEFKNLLTKEEFSRLEKFLNIHKHDFYSQENHYFDTNDFSLKERGCALRIRKKNGHFELTLKQPASVGLLETNQLLTEKEANLMLHKGKIIEGIVADELNKMQIPLEKLQFFGSLKTERAETKYKDGVLVLDKSTYLNKEDFEIEYEVNDEAKGKEVFKQLLGKLNIPMRKTKNKIQRFYDAKFAENNTGEK